MSKIVVVGGGAAGLLCAAKSAEKGNDVIIIEKMNRCGRKLMITGKGRCNVTNASFELDDLISNVFFILHFQILCLMILWLCLKNSACR